jgi:dolichyl-diphosphooligosaccharide--protein glycosyltransferase/undecaprenyl-diphosphooligosaccharide--protein glycosyltransferase
MNKQFTTKQMMLFMLAAYLFSVVVRMIWIWQFKDDPNVYWNGQIMINTNDGYFFASGAQKELFGIHLPNPRVPDLWDYGVVFFTTLFCKITPFSLETITLYMPTFISSLVVVPIILISRLFGKTLWGFLAALLGSIAWSYYNRTMTGYYDTDMFSAMAPMFILYFLIKSTIDFNLRSALYAAIAIVLYPFLYDQGLAIVYAIGITYGTYMMWYHRDSKVTYESLLLVFLALLPIGLEAPAKYIVHLLIIAIAYVILSKKEFETKQLMIGSGIVFVAFLLLGNVFGLIIAKIFSYTLTGTSDEGLHFYGVNQTVREAGHIPFSTFANRISGSMLGLWIAIIGYIVLVMRKPVFILALPLVGIGVFANWGGLRFTVYAVPVAAMSAVYLFFVIAEYIKDKKAKYAFVILSTIALIVPNINHVIRYKVSTVFSKAEVQDLDRLNKLAGAKDYTLAWWDYGYPIWYYSDTSTIIDGGKHNNDNFIISKIMQTTSPTLAANLSRLAVETYESNGHKIIVDTIFKNKQKDQIDPNEFLLKLDDPNYKLPKKTRDIYLYLPYKMLGIYPTVTLFGNLDLTTGKKLKNVVFYPSRIVAKNKNGLLTFANGIKFDLTSGVLLFRKREEKVNKLIITQNTQKGKININTKRYHPNAGLNAIYMKSYNRFVIMDEETLHSTYVQMFILGRYDHNLFELVVASPYSRIYKLKK